MAQLFLRRLGAGGVAPKSAQISPRIKQKPQPYGHGFCFVVKEGQYLQLAFQYSREHNASVRHPFTFCFAKR